MQIQIHFAPRRDRIFIGVAMLLLLSTQIMAQEHTGRLYRSGETEEELMSKKDSESQNAEGQIDETSKPSANLNLPAPIVPQAFKLKCNLSQYGDSLPFPTIVIDLDQFYVIEGKAAWLPMHPGTAGNNTIAGIDADGDCVRDDIEHYIAKQFPETDQKMVRKYLFEYAKWLGEFLRAGISEDYARGISNNLYKSSECTRRILGDTAQTADRMYDLFSKFHNTIARSKRYFSNNELLGGWVTREVVEVVC